jgi:phosphoribosylglycinamide formyltransferase-1
MIFMSETRQTCGLRPKAHHWMFPWDGLHFLKWPSQGHNNGSISFLFSPGIIHLRMQQIAIFASGAGSNAARIIDHFRQHPSIKISLIVCNKPGAGVLNIAAQEHIPSLLIEKERFFRGDAYIPQLQELNISFIVLAGFLWKIPPELVQAYSRRIVNIHPALLPKYGGKGMYGHLVHEAVIRAKEKESGITIHFVDELYDHGQTIFQATCIVEDDDTPETLAQKVHWLEYEHFPRIIEEVLTDHRSVG